VRLLKQLTIQQTCDGMKLSYDLFRRGLMMDKKYVVIIQCDLTHNRCSGFACTHSFYKRTDKFKNYNEDVQYISFTCGGCCGKGVSSKIEHLMKKLKNNTDIDKEEVSIHLSSCMTTDNYHADRCPHLDYIKYIIEKKGFNNIVEGSYISKTSTQLRGEGIYNTY